MTQTLAIILLLALSQANAGRIPQCISPHPPLTRTFASLTDYQGNNLSFRPGGAGYSGNYVEFSFVSIDEIPKNTFIAYSSESIWKLTLKDKRIRQISDGAFNGLDCAHVLELQNNSLMALSEGMFEGLTNLATLNLADNLIGALQSSVFKRLINLKSLDLSKNRISAVRMEAFESLGRLESLNLGHNLLSKIHPEAFTPLGKLQALELDSNRFSNLDLERWINLTRLTELNLAGNELLSFDPDYNFSFASSLNSLNLSMNRLTKLNVQSLRRNLPKLSTIDLNGNPWLCEYLPVVLPRLRDSKIEYVKTAQNVTNEDGVPCLFNNATFFEPTTTYIAMTTRESTTVVPSVQVDHLKNLSLELRDDLKDSTEEFMASLNKTQNLVIALIVVVLIFIILQLTLRTGLLGKLLSRRDPYVLDNSSVDNIALLRT